MSCEKFATKFSAKSYVNFCTSTLGNCQVTQVVFLPLNNILSSVAGWLAVVTWHSCLFWKHANRQWGVTVVKIDILSIRNWNWGETST